MAARKQKSQINLLPQKGFESSTTGRVLAWILSTFRIIVMATELIVMVAFLSRFWLDAQNSDLSEELRQKQAILTASQDFEVQFKDVQNRLKVYSEITTAQRPLYDYLKSINSYLPTDVTLTAIKYTPNEFNVEGVTINEKSIQQLAVNLKSSNYFKTVEVSLIRSRIIDPSQLEFKVSADFNQ